MEQETIHYLQNQIGEILNFKKLDNQGCTSIVYKIKTRDNYYLLKTTNHNIYDEWLKKEASTLKSLINQNEISVPKFYDFFKIKNTSNLLMSFENGITLSEALNSNIQHKQKLKLIEKFGQYIYHLHSLDTNKFHFKHDDWLTHQLIKAEKYLNSNQTEGNQKLLTILKKEKPKYMKQTIIHGDYTIDNVLINLDGSFKFIDVSGMEIGDPRYDEALAIRKFINKHDYLNAFYKGYQYNKITFVEYNYFCNGLYEFF